MRAAILDGQTVINLIEVRDPADVPGCIPCADSVRIADIFDGAAFARPPEPPQSAEETRRRITAEVQRHMDAQARVFGYDDIARAASYADEPAVLKFQAEGRAFRAWRSRVWEYCYAVLADVEAGTREAPDARTLIDELPPLVVSAP